jgi:hypothetical protein
MRCKELIETAKKRRTASKWLKDEIKTWETRREKYGLNSAEQQRLCILYSTLTNTQTNDNPLYKYCKTCSADQGSKQRSPIKEQPKKSVLQRIALKDVTSLHGKYRYASFMRPLGAWFNPCVPFKVETVKSSDKDFRYNRAPYSVISTGSKLPEGTLKKFELIDLAKGREMQELIKYINSFDFLNSSMKGQLHNLILKGESKVSIDKYIEKGRKMAEKKKPVRQKFSLSTLKAPSKLSKRSKKIAPRGSQKVTKTMSYIPSNALAKKTTPMVFADRDESDRFNFYAKFTNGNFGNLATSESEFMRGARNRGFKEENLFELRVAEKQVYGQPIKWIVLRKKSMPKPTKTQQGVLNREEADKKWEKFEKGVLKHTPAIKADVNEVLKRYVKNAKIETSEKTVKIYSPNPENAYSAVLKAIEKVYNAQGQPLVRKIRNKILFNGYTISVHKQLGTTFKPYTGEYLGVKYKVFTNPSRIEYYKNGVHKAAFDEPFNINTRSKKYVDGRARITILYMTGKSPKEAKKDIRQAAILSKKQKSTTPYRTIKKTPDEARRDKLQELNTKIAALKQSIAFDESKGVKPITNIQTCNRLIKARDKMLGIIPTKVSKSGQYTQPSKRDIAIDDAHTDWDNQAKAKLMYNREFRDKSLKACIKRHLKSVE